MAYRNGTYIAFHADGTNQPGKSDIDCYNLMKAWTARTDDDFTMINSHEKTSAVRDTSKRSTLGARLLERLRNSKNMVLIIGVTTKNDTDWVPFEITQAIDTYRIPIIAAYTDYTSILDPADCVRSGQRPWPNGSTARSLM
ncbi:MAG: TIR domain-containing protein [Propionivibrio sp.]|nr:TIR domain-containing protein [Propionivibrio sp.]